MDNHTRTNIHDQWWARLGVRPVRDGGALKPLMCELLDWLSAEGYARTTTHNVIRAALRLGDWMNRDGITIADLEPGTITALIYADNTAHPTHRVANESTGAVLRFLQATGRITPAERPQPAGEAEACLTQWCTTLDVAGHGTSWIEKARSWTGPFLDLLENTNGNLQWHRADAELINDYVLAFSHRYSASSTQSLAALLRALLTWAAVEGRTDHDRSSMVLSVRRTPSRLPQGLSTDQVEALSDSIDTTTVLGKRDLAIIVMLTRLGVRVSEVAGLTLDDIDWRDPSLRVVGKNGRVLALPMPVDVGDTLVDYLHHRRCQPGDRHVFIRALAPLTAMGRTAISNVVTNHAHTAGLSGVHAHLLRHTAATGILTNGGDLETVRQLLGHATTASSLPYARLDHEPLRKLAPTWGRLS